ncbi:alpha/beta hydrolase [Thelonectria olida]|uniref:Alpha/beta hydrolase n=1 Tax=Thelonectria olida TaxID=1576542 RepID=A0A9P9AHW9_9HYPO|nr:alpha/beta hydrolase [Thelonectria olida]
MSSLWSKQPFKLVYIFLIVPPAIVVSSIHAVLFSLLRCGRPHSNWSFRQAVAVRLVKSLIRHQSELRMPTPLSLAPGSEGDRFVVISPAAPARFRGLADDIVIQPSRVGGTWSPAPIPALPREQHDQLVVLHFHGGAYVMGNGRDSDMGFLARTLLQNTPCTHIFTPQYRLSNNPGGRFPAALQDAISTYSYLLHDLGIAASQIIVSGDSAGGNLALALLRYVASFGSETDLPAPRAALLWSPWVDLAFDQDPRNCRLLPNYPTDYIHANFACWGVETLTGGGVVSVTDSYISPVNSPFRSETPIWVHTGGKEVLYGENLRLVEQFRRVGSTVELAVEELAPHDILSVGPLLGFENEAVLGARNAGEFLGRILD